MVGFPWQCPCDASGEKKRRRGDTNRHQHLLSLVPLLKETELLTKRARRLFNDVNQCMLAFLDLGHRKPTSGRSSQANPPQGTGSMETAA